MNVSFKASYGVADKLKSNTEYQTTYLPEREAYFNKQMQKWSDDNGDVVQLTHYEKKGIQTLHFDLYREGEDVPSASCEYRKISKFNGNDALRVYSKLKNRASSIDRMLKSLTNGNFVDLDAEAIRTVRENKIIYRAEG